MSDVAQGPGWWQASDGRWYPPEALPQVPNQGPPPPEAAGPGPDGGNAGSPREMLPQERSGQAAAGPASAPGVSGATAPPGFVGYAGYAGQAGPVSQAGYAGEQNLEVGPAQVGAPAVPISGTGTYGGPGYPGPPGGPGPYGGPGSPGPGPFAQPFTPRGQYVAPAMIGGPGQVAPPGYGQQPAHRPPGYPWSGYETDRSLRRSRVIGALLVLLGLAGVLWGIGELYAALALNSSPLYPHDEQVGAWILTCGILLASVVTMAIGLVYRRG